MELHPTPFPVKSKYMKPKSTKKTSEAPKTNTKSTLLLSRERRVFGTARNPNIPSKTASQNPGKAKPSSGPPKKPAKPSQSTRSPPISEAKKSPEKNPSKPKKKKKSVCFETNENVTEPQTPLRSPAVARLSIGTPYQSAGRCSKCRFDKLETSAYWLGQIKLSESVGKHFVSAAFFRLALDCTAEPVRNIRVELKKYLARHDYLNGEELWRKLLVSYGVLKEESRAAKENLKAGAEEENASFQNQEDYKDNLQEEITEENEILNLS